MREISLHKFFLFLPLLLNCETLLSQERMSLKRCNGNYSMFLSPGVQIFENVSVESIITDGKSITAVETNRGNVKCETFVNCGGQVNNSS